MGLGAAVVIVALAAPTALAQCPEAREVAMAGNGKTHGRIGVDMVDPTVPTDPIAWLNNQTEVATFWETGTNSNNAGGAHFGTPSTCPSDTGAAGLPWWKFGGAGADVDDRSIQFFISSPGCTLPFCPAAEASITVLVEDQSDDGLKAGFITYTANETPGPIRWWDLARTDPATQPSNDVIHTFWAYPTVDTTTSSGPPPSTTVTNNYRDVAINTWVVGPSGPLPPNSVIDSYDIVYHHGPGEPATGRVRSGWTFLQSIPYSNAGVIGDSFLVPCPSPLDSTFLAVGITVDGVESYYVGESTAVACDPTIAEPDEPTIRPRNQLRRKPLSRGGR
jgi:hypothetical protein